MDARGESVRHESGLTGPCIEDPRPRNSAGRFPVASSTAPARAALADEIQVYTDDIDQPGEFGLELHVNTTPRGLRTPDFPGEVTPARGIRLTPELSWGLTRTLEAASTCLTCATRREHTSRARSCASSGCPCSRRSGTGWFGGLNAEYAWIAPELEQSTRALELRPIIGYRGAVAAGGQPRSLAGRWPGPITTASRTSAPRSRSRARSHQASPGRRVLLRAGKVGNFLAHGALAHLPLALDYDRKPWAFNVGIGRGLNDATDRWTLKAIFESLSTKRSALRPVRRPAGPSSAGSARRRP